jgi:hypothetical protein
MPGPRLPMRKIRDVLRLSAAGMSKRKIAASLGVSATSAGECTACGPGLAATGRPDGRSAGGPALPAAHDGGQGSSAAAGLGGASPRAAPARGDAAVVVGGASRCQS